MTCLYGKNLILRCRLLYWLGRNRLKPQRFKACDKQNVHVNICSYISYQACW